MRGPFRPGGRQLRNATVLDYGNSKKAVRLEFDGATAEISIYRDAPVVELDFPAAGETRIVDDPCKSGEFVQFESNGWTVAGMGRFGVMVPQRQVKSLRSSAGKIERVVSGAHTAYYFAGDIRQLGGELAQRMIPRRAAGVPFTYTNLHQPKGYTAIGDIDGDGRNDIVIRSSTQLSWLHYPDYEPRPIHTGRFAGDRYARRIDGDGDLDVITSLRTDKPNEYIVAWYENPGMGGASRGRPCRLRQRHQGRRHQSRRPARRGGAFP